MHHLQKSYLDWNAFARRAYLYKELGLCLINRKVLRTNLGVHPSPPHHAGGPPIFVDWSFEHQFNLSSRIKSVLLMWEARTLWWAIITDKTKNWKFANFGYSFGITPGIWILQPKCLSCISNFNLLCNEWWRTQCRKTLELFLECHFSLISL